SPSLNSKRVVAKAPYSIYVDKGHRTRQGRGRAPNYRPKQGGISFVPANPFFSSVIDQIKNGLLKQALHDNMQAVLNRKPPAYSEIRISKTTGKKYRVYKRKDSVRGRLGGRSTTRGF